MNLKYEVLTGAFESDLKRIARGVNPPNLVEILRKGADVILDQAQRNVLERELYDSGDLYDSLHILAINQYRVDVVAGSDSVPYAAVHEYGGTFKITDRQRGFFWARFMATGESMWRALALSETYTIPPRPYLRPAVDEKKKEAVWEMTLALSRYFTKILKLGGTT